MQEDSVNLPTSIGGGLEKASPEVEGASQVENSHPAAEAPQASSPTKAPYDTTPKSPMELVEEPTEEHQAQENTDSSDESDRIEAGCPVRENSLVESQTTSRNEVSNDKSAHDAAMVTENTDVHVKKEEESVYVVPYRGSLPRDSETSPYPPPKPKGEAPNIYSYGHLLRRNVVKPRYPLYKKTPHFGTEEFGDVKASCDSESLEDQLKKAELFGRLLMEEENLGIFEPNAPSVTSKSTVNTTDEVTRVTNCSGEPALKKLKEEAFSVKKVKLYGVDLPIPFIKPKLENESPNIYSRRYLRSQNKEVPRYCVYDTSKAVTCTGPPLTIDCLSPSPRESLKVKKEQELIKSESSTDNRLARYFPLSGTSVKKEIPRADSSDVCVKPEKFSPNCDSSTTNCESKQVAQVSPSKIEEGMNSIHVASVPPQSSTATLAVSTTNYVTSLPAIYNNVVSAPLTYTEAPSMPCDYDNCAPVPPAHSQVVSVPRAHSQFTSALPAHSQVASVSRAHSQFTSALPAHNQVVSVSRAHSQFTSATPAHSQVASVPFSAHGTVPPSVNCGLMLSMYNQTASGPSSLGRSGIPNPSYNASMGTSGTCLSLSQGPSQNTRGPDYAAFRALQASNRAAHAPSPLRNDPIPLFSITDIPAPRFQPDYMSVLAQQQLRYPSVQLTVSYNPVGPARAELNTGGHAVIDLGCMGYTSLQAQNPTIYGAVARARRFITTILS